MGNQGCGWGCNAVGRDPSTEKGTGGWSTYIPSELFKTLTPEQWTLLFQSWETNNSNTDNTSTTSDLTNQTQPTATLTTPTSSETPSSLVCQMLSNTHQSAQSANDQISINGQYYTAMGRSSQMAIVYTIFDAGLGLGVLGDGGANGDDVCILETDPLAKVDVTGIGDEVFKAMPIVQCAGLVQTMDKGKIIFIMSQYAQQKSGRTIHSKNQMESFGCHVLDSSQNHRGKQSVITPEGYVIPLHIRNGLFYMDMSKPDEDDLSCFPHCFLASNSPWDPSIVDEEFLYTDEDDSIVTCLCEQ